MKKRIATLAIIVLLGVGPAFLRAQGTAAGKIGVINIQEAIASTSEGKKTFAEMQKKYEPRQEELARLQQEIQSIQDQLQKQAATLSDEEQRRLNRDLEDKQKVLKRKTEDANADWQTERDEAIRRIGQKMVALISQYAQQNGYALVMDNAQIPVYYASKDIDLTEEIVKRFDAANPVAADASATPSGTPASAPAARPAAPPSVRPGATAKPGDSPKR